MGLEDTFGSEFAEQVQKEVQQKRHERNSLTEKVAREVSALAVNERKFESGDPMFTFTSDGGVTHEVLLVQLPDMENGSVWNQVNELDSGAISLPLDYMGEWIWSIFNDREEAKKMEEGNWYIAVGNLDEWVPDEGANAGEPQDQFSPVRGIITMDEAKSYADEEMGEGDEVSSSTGSVTGDTIQQEDESDDEDEEDDTPSFGSSSSGDDEDNEEPDDDEPAIEATYSDVAGTVEALAESEPEVWEANPDHEDWDNLVYAVCRQVEEDPEKSDVWDEVTGIIAETIEEHNEEEEEDDDDSIFS